METEVDSNDMILSMPDMPDSRNWFAPAPPSRRRVFSRSHRQGVHITVDGATLLNFAANDYLGLSFHPGVREAALASLRSAAVGAGASRLVTGDDPVMHELESALARWKGFEAALVVGSGMLANMGLLDALAARGTQLFCDKLNHASLLDGARLCHGVSRRYPHLDLARLEHLLRAHAASRRIIVSDGVFSMDGDCARARDMMLLAEQYDALLVLDDAHGLGVLGPAGQGLSMEAGIQGHARLIEVGTCGKALGAYGAFILGTSEMIEGLRQHLHTMIYSTALPPCIAAAALEALRILQAEALPRRLGENVRLFLDLAARHPALPLIASHTPIQPLILGDDETALQAAFRLREVGFFVPAIRPPTVPEGTARLRITLSAAHTGEQIERLVEALATVVKKKRGTPFL